MIRLRILILIKTYPHRIDFLYACLCTFFLWCVYLVYFTRVYLLSFSVCTTSEQTSQSSVSVDPSQKAFGMALGMVDMSFNHVAKSFVVFTPQQIPAAALLVCIVPICLYAFILVYLLVRRGQVIRAQRAEQTSQGGGGTISGGPESNRSDNRAKENADGPSPNASTSDRMVSRASSQTSGGIGEIDTDEVNVKNAPRKQSAPRKHSSGGSGVGRRAGMKRGSRMAPTLHKFIEFGLGVRHIERRPSQQPRNSMSSHRSSHRSSASSCVEEKVNTDGSTHLGSTPVGSTRTPSYVGDESRTSNYAFSFCTIPQLWWQVRRDLLNNVYSCGLCGVLNSPTRIRYILT